MATSYRRVPQEEESGNSESLEAHVTRSRGERLQDKLIARKSAREEGNHPTPCEQTATQPYAWLTELFLPFSTDFY